MASCLLSEMEVDHSSAVDALTSRMRAATGRRLRSLRVSFVAGRFRVTATCPFYHGRQLAEQAAVRLFPADQLEFYVHVVPPDKRRRTH